MKRRFAPFITRNILLLAVVSFFTDVASEMLYPILPLYLSDIGYGIVLIGLIEGLAQVFTGIIKLSSGLYSDQARSRKSLITVGYGISAVAKPLMAFFPVYGAIFGFRLLDRFGKGIRNAPRDALLADDSTPETRGQVFGFHRALDTLGATLGPIITLGILYFYTDNIPLIIGLTAIPGIGAVAASLLLRERPSDASSHKEKFSMQKVHARLRSYAASASLSYKRTLGIIGVLTLLKSTDIYLLLRARELGLSDTLVISAYILYNLAGTLLVYQLGKLCDRIGYRITFSFAALALGATYIILSQSAVSLTLVFGAFVIYAVFQASYEGLGSAWLSLHIPAADRASGLGVMMAFQAVLTLIGTLVVGLAWSFAGAHLVFAIVGVLAVAFAGYLFYFRRWA